MSNDDTSANEEHGFEELYPFQKPWSRQARQIAAIIWPSFLAAAFATMLFFAVIDPQALGDSMEPSQRFSRMTGYGLGFFFFWFITMLSSSISILLIRSYNRTADHKAPEQSDEQNSR